MRSRTIVRALAVAILVVGGRGAAAQEAGEVPTATPLEQAVIEHVCRVPGQAMLPAEAYGACLANQLASLRTEFGKDLQRLSAAERRAIDKACSALRIERGRDAYIACLSGRLTGLIVARGHTPPGIVPVPDPPDEPAVPTETAAAPAMPAVPVPLPETPHASSRSAAWLGALVVMLAGGGVWGLIMRRRSKPAIMLCRVCGELAGAGDLCAACRHEAAETQRRAAAERSEQQVAVVEAARRAQDEAEAQEREARQAAEREAEDAQRRQREAALQAQIEREQEAARRREEDRRRWQEAAVAAIAEESPIDPHAVLGVPADATADQIRAAYDEARKKYAPEQVSHLGSELQEHYRTKAQAVERAFERLTGVVQA